MERGDTARHGETQNRLAQLQRRHARLRVALVAGRVAALLLAVVWLGGMAYSISLIGRRRFPCGPNTGRPSALGALL